MKRHLSYALALAFLITHLPPRAAAQQADPPPGEQIRQLVKQINDLKSFAATTGLPASAVQPSVDLLATKLAALLRQEGARAGLDARTVEQVVAEVVRGAGAGPAPPREPPRFEPSASMKSASGRLEVRADRVDGQLNRGLLRIHLDPTLSGFEVTVRDLSAGVPDDRREIYSKVFDQLERGVTGWTLGNIPLAARGDTEISVKARGADGEQVTLRVAPRANLLSAEKQADDPPEYDWGRVRGYFASGVTFSKERDNFSKSDIFLSFTLDKSYLNEPWGPIKNVNTYFSAQLAAVPIASATPTPTPAASPTPTPTPCNSAECEAFVSSQKAALLQAGVYVPMYADFMTWKRTVRPARGGERLESNALFVAPLAQGGVLTVTGDRRTAEADAFGRDDVFNFFSFGARIGHFRTYESRDAAPELISWLDFGRGRYEMFEIAETVRDADGRPVRDAEGDEVKVRRRPWRWVASGRLRVPETPFLVGFDGNFGRGPDDLRFIFGTRFDIGKLLRTIKLATANDTYGRSAAPPTR